MSHIVVNGRKRHVGGFRPGHPLQPGHPNLFKLATDAAPTPSNAKVDLADQIPPQDQGQTGDCTQYGVTINQLGFLELKAGRPWWQPSAFDGYYYTKAFEGTSPTEDTGADPLDVCRMLANRGVCSESTWSSVAHLFSDKPDAAADTEATQHKTEFWYAMYSEAEIQQRIVDGFIVGFGFACFESLDSDLVHDSGDIPFPEPSEKGIGGHCMSIYAYDKDIDLPGDPKGTGVYGIIQSWGADWGHHARGRISGRYFKESLASQFCCISRFAL